MPPDDLDATIRMPRGRAGTGSSAGAKSPGAARKGFPWLAVSGGVAALAIACGVGFWLLRPSPRPLPIPAPVPVPAPAPLTQAPPLPALPLLSEAAILAERVDVPTAIRFAPNARILVIDFPSLTAQGRAFNRMAAFVEKHGQPRDRVLNDTEMNAALAADNATVDTYYYGHDYRAADVARFYATADRQGMALAPEEQALRKMLADAGFLASGANEAVISIPREGSDQFVDASGRASLLRHELSHGEYFTVPAYAAFTQRFWNETMNPADRAAFREFLTRQDYDPADEDLIINEMQAHLMHTPDIRYFNARACGLPLERIDELRTLFLANMPASWLRDTDTAAYRK